MTEIIKPVITFPIEINKPGFISDSKSSIRYLVSKNGIFLRKSLLNGDGYIQFKVDGIDFLEESKEEIKFLPKKIPFCFYEETVIFFKHVMKKLQGNNEAYILIGYNKTSDQFFFFVPKQTVSGATVKYDLTDFYVEHPECLIVMEFHSHNTMGAHFSSVDDKDDCRDRYSGVIGNLNRLIPSVALRFGCMRKHWKVEIEEIFSDENIDYQYKIDLDKEMGKVSLYVHKDVTVQESNSESLSFYKTFLGARYGGLGKNYYSNIDVHGIYDNPTQEEINQVYDWTWP